MSITAQHIAPQGGGFEPQRTYNFWMELFGAPGADIIKLAIVSGFSPIGSNDPISVPYFGEERFVAGRAKFRQGSITCADYVDEAVLASLWEWRKMVYDPDSGAIHYASNYKKQAAVILTDGEGGATRTWKLEGVWPIDLQQGNLQYSNSAYVQLTCTLSYDKASFQG